MKKKSIKFIKWFFIAIACVLIFVAIVDNSYTASERLFFGGMGLFIFLLVLVARARWICISLFSFAMVITGIPEIINEDHTLDIYYLLLVVAFFIVGIVYTRKTLGQFRLTKISKVSMAEIDSMTGLEFEEYTANLLKKLGYIKVEVTKASGDQGIDVLAQKDGFRYAIQCKNYANKLDNTPVQEVYAGKDFYGYDIGVVITNSTFTAGAQELARALGVLLWDRSVLQEMITNAKGIKQIEPETPLNVTAEILTEPDLPIEQPETVPTEIFIQVFESGLDNAMLPIAMDVILQEQQASVSLLQRRLKMGYAQAAKVIGEMETKGLVGPFVGSHPRKIIITKNQWKQIRERIPFDSFPILSNSQLDQMRSWYNSDDISSPEK